MRQHDDGQEKAQTLLFSLHEMRQRKAVEKGEAGNNQSSADTEEGDSHYEEGRRGNRFAKDACDLPEMREQGSLLVDAADQLRRRSTDHILPLRKVHTWLEKLRVN